MRTDRITIGSAENENLYHRDRNGGGAPVSPYVCLASRTSIFILLEIAISSDAPSIPAHPRRARRRGSDRKSREQFCPHPRRERPPNSNRASNSRPQITVRYRVRDQAGTAPPIGLWRRPAQKGKQDGATTKRITAMMRVSEKRDHPRYTPRSPRPTSQENRGISHHSAITPRGGIEVELRQPPSARIRL